MAQCFFLNYCSVLTKSYVSEHSLNCFLVVNSVTCQKTAEEINMRVTSEQHSALPPPRVVETNASVVSRNVCVSLATNFVSRYKVSEVAKLGNACDLSPKTFFVKQ